MSPQLRKDIDAYGGQQEKNFASFD